MAADATTVVTLSGDPIIEEARKRWNRCSEWEAQFRQRFLDDLRFRHGDSDNMYQWPNAIRRSRNADSKPCLTMNVIRQHNFQIVNEAKKNKSAVKVMAIGGDATQESAQIMKALIRHIEYQSNAQSIYSNGMQFQVDGGIGWWRIITKWCQADVPEFDQEIYLLPIIDPLAVYSDPDIKQFDGSDAKFSLVFSPMMREEFEEEWPEHEGLGDLQPLGIGITGDRWTDQEQVLLCEYFRVVKKKERLISFVDPSDGKRKVIRKSELPPEVAKEVQGHKLSRWRDVEEDKVEWRLIAGEKVIQKEDWPGKYIPLIRCVGEEVVIEGQLDRKGHTRAMKDSQRMFNYNASAQVEFVALQTKTPWVAAVKAIEGFEQYWNAANTANPAVLPFNHVDDNNNQIEIPKPERIIPPTSSTAYKEGMETAFNQMMMVSGQWQNQMGMMGNERTGAAIGKRQEQSDTATYHFQDNFATAIRFTGKQLIDLIPKIYDTERVIKVLADDGTDFEVEIDPSAKQAFLAKRNHQGEVIRRIFNPGLGQYDIAADVGPAYGSRRQETVEALTLILTQNPGLTGIVGDLLLKAMDFDEAQEASIRLRRMVPPQALGQGPSPQEQQLQAQIQQLQVALQKALEKAGKDQVKLVGKDTLRDIEVYRAETERMAALQKMLPTDPEGLQRLIHQLVGDAMKSSLDPLMASLKGSMGQSLNGSSTSTQDLAPIPGAQKAPDGQWYLSDPTRRGKYLRIAPLAQEKSNPSVIANG